MDTPATEGSCSLAVSPPTTRAELVTWLRNSARRATDGNHGSAREPADGHGGGAAASEAMQRTVHGAATERSTVASDRARGGPRPRSSGVGSQRIRQRAAGHGAPHLHDSEHRGNGSSKGQNWYSASLQHSGRAATASHAAASALGPSGEVGTARAVVGTGASDAVATTPRPVLLPVPAGAGVSSAEYREVTTASAAARRRLVGKQSPHDSAYGNASKVAQPPEQGRPVPGTRSCAVIGRPPET
jgi:hypothetical protein